MFLLGSVVIRTAEVTRNRGACVCIGFVYDSTWSAIAGRQVPTVDKTIRTLDLTLGF